MVGKGPGVRDAAPGSCLESCCGWCNGEAVGFLCQAEAETSPECITRQCPSTGPALLVPNL